MDQLEEVRLAKFTAFFNSLTKYYLFLNDNYKKIRELYYSTENSLPKSEEQKKLIKELEREIQKGMSYSHHFKKKSQYRSYKDFRNQGPSLSVPVKTFDVLFLVTFDTIHRTFANLMDNTIKMNPEKVGFYLNVLRSNINIISNCYNQLQRGLIEAQQNLKKVA